MIVRHPRPFVLGIVGHAADKFTPQTCELARYEIERYLIKSKPDKLVSGGCHLGGVDVWAIKIATELGIPTEEYLPENLRWTPNGYKERNLRIARSNRVLCVVVRDYPPEFKGQKFDYDGCTSGCYHCLNRNFKHVKSGGCWTAWKCKEREWIII